MIIVITLSVSFFKIDLLSWGRKLLVADLSVEEKQY